MQRLLYLHISYLEQKIETLKAQLEDEDRTESEKATIRIDIHIAERALVHFKKAYELERKISV